jgi:alpha-mannosidase
MTPKYKLYIVPHTHWDREWYGSFQMFRVRLVRLVNKLLDLLEHDPDYRAFTLDGQTIILEDYLEVHPENRQTLVDYIRDGRLMIGPWYILPDEFLTSGESLVRNLLLGEQMAGEFGKRMDVGYIPDTFGHIAQLPQVLNGFGLDTCMNFRGLDSADRASELWWASPDGSRVLLHHMSTIIGYSDVGALPDHQQRAAYDLRALAYYKAERATSSVLLGMQGVDHAEARTDLTQIIGIANDTFEDVEFIHATLEDFWSALKASVPGDTLETVTGELRDVPRSDGSMNFLLYNVLSSRADNKLANAKTLVALEQWAEPWAVLAQLWDIADYPAGHLWTGWKWLLKNHPHDSIGGCSVDAVHRQMMTRFEWATEIADYLTEERHRLLAEQLDMSDAQPNEYALVLFNGTPYPVDQVVTLDVDLPDAWLKQQAVASLTPDPEITRDSHFLDVLAVNTRADWLHGAPTIPEIYLRSIIVRPDGQNPVPVQIHSLIPTTTASALASGPRAIHDVRRVRASFHAMIPAYGYTTVYVRPDTRPTRWQPKYPSAPHVLQNEHLRVTVQPNGTFNMELLASGTVYRGLGLLEDSGDNGDGYTFSPPITNRTYTTITSSPMIQRLGDDVGLHQVRIVYELPLPVGLDATRQCRQDATVICPVEIDLTLREGSPLLEITVQVDNRAKDHRLRLLFPTPYTDLTQATSGMQFDAQTRPIAPQPIEPDGWWVEDPPNTFPMHGWMSVNGKESGLSVLAEGVYEFGVPAAENGRAVALTLLRAVGYLGARRDPTTILGGAGPGIPTPEAQLQTTLTYRLALYPHLGDWSEAATPQIAQTFLAPPRAVGTVPTDGERPTKAEGIRVEGGGVLSAVKQSEDGDAMVIRLYNPDDSAASSIIHLPVPASGAIICRLDETPLEALPLQDKQRLNLALAPRQIVSVRVILEASAAG